MSKLKSIFNEITVAKAVYEEICSAGQGLVGSFELEEAVKNRIIVVKNATSKLLVTALLDPLAIGEAETDGIVLDDKAARRKARTLKLNVIGTLRVLRMMYDAKLIDKTEIIEALTTLRETGFRISDDLIIKVKDEL